MGNSKSSVTSNMSDSKVLINNLFIKHTDGGVPDCPEDLFNKDLYNEVALDILYDILLASNHWEEED